MIYYLNSLQEIIRHPSYKSRAKNDDIALLRLTTPIEFNEYMRPACLRTVLSDIEPDVELFVTGWGSTKAERKDTLFVISYV